MYYPLYERQRIEILYFLKEKMSSLVKELDILFGSGGRDRTYDQLINSQLHYRCATPEYVWCPLRDLNSRPPAYKADALATVLKGRENIYIYTTTTKTFSEVCFHSR